MWRKIEKALEDHLRREGWNVSEGFAAISAYRRNDHGVSIDLEKLAKMIEADLK